MEENVKVYVCFHDESLIPEVKKNIKNNKLYVPLFIGAKAKKNNEFCNDSNGDNISNLNPFYSELTGIYWMCKNSDADIIGLCHYRRYFINFKYGGRLLNKEDILKNLKEYDIILPKGDKPLEGSNYDSYQVWNEFFDLAYDVIKEKNPEYIPAFNHVIKGEYPISYFNMFISSKKLINDYCDWIIPILNELLPNVDESNQRILGVISEYLFNVYIYHNNFKIKEFPLRFTGRKYKFRMFILKLNVLRFLYKNVYYPINSKINKI